MLLIFRRLLLRSFLSSHCFVIEAILSISNELFYSNRLLACAALQETSKLLDWRPDTSLYPFRYGSPATATAAVTENCALWVIGVDGNDAHEIDSPSFYNMDEVRVIVNLVQNLCARPDVYASDFGVIAPYWRQVRKIREALRQEGLGQVRVGLVEDYQGQEVAISIVSTTLARHRDSIERVLLSKSHHGNATSGRGILGSAKGFNVSLSRAKALQIVVGNPVALEADVYGRGLLVKALKWERFVGSPCSADVLAEAGVNLVKGHAEVLAEGTVLGSIVDHLGEMAVQFAIDKTGGPDGKNFAWEEEDAEDEWINPDLTGLAGTATTLSDFSAFAGGIRSFGLKFS